MNSFYYFVTVINRLKNFILLRRFKSITFLLNRRFTNTYLQNNNIVSKGCFLLRLNKTQEEIY
jgi:hypothetical protein